ncbi:MAG: 3-keto-5-aminohexanoate cleavage protein [Chloroflexi bacterium]|nr:3-keto-5-aminohexanoate cleavage protein [Chloroflexota bacterium]
MENLIIHATINEGLSRAECPSVPITPEEIARDALACVEAGATMVHFHARDPKTGEQLWLDTDLTAQAIRLIRKNSKVPVYLPYPGSRMGVQGPIRFSHVVTLAKDPTVRLDLAVFNPGAWLISKYDKKKKQFQNPDAAMVHPHADATYFLQTCRELGIAPMLGLGDAGMVRHVEAYLDMGLLKEPVFVKYVFFGDVPSGLPPTTRGLEIFEELMRGIRHRWIVQAPIGNYWPFLNASLPLGGHVRAGVGDTLADEQGKPATSVELIDAVVRKAKALRRSVANVIEAREILGLKS